MGRWKTGYEFTNKRKVFKTCYILCSIVNIFGIVNLWRVHYHDNELNLSKWLGGVIGTIQSAGIIALVYCLCNVFNLQGLGIILFVLYIIYLILFGFFYKTER